MALYKVKGTVINIYTDTDTYYIESSYQPTLAEAKALTEEYEAEPVTQTYSWTDDLVEESNKDEFEKDLGDTGDISPWMGHKLIINGDDDV